MNTKSTSKKNITSERLEVGIPEPPLKIVQPAPKEPITFLKGLAILFILGFIFWYFHLIPGEGGPRVVQCSFPAGFTCITYKLYANTSKFYVEVGQGTGHEIRINGISCTKNTSENYSKTSIISYGGGNSMKMQSGTTAVLSTPTDASKLWLNISCTDANGNLPSDTGIAALYSGKIYINYTEMDTNITRIVIGTYTTKYEA